MSFVVNTQYTITSRFFDTNGAETDPTTVTVTTLNPAGTQTVLTNTHPSTGVYTNQWTPDTAGLWTISVKGTGALLVHASDIKIEVENSFTP